MKVCAFCLQTATLSAEHIVSDWMSDLFPGHFNTRLIDSKGVDSRFRTKGMDWKARVVCGACNNGWMSDIENNIAKPLMTPLITREKQMPIGQSEARSLAIFAFKTAVVLDAAQRRPVPFYPRHVRTSFMKHSIIPSNVGMWFCGYDGHRRNVHIRAIYYSTKLTFGDDLRVYVCTCAFGYFVFQVVSVQHIRQIALEPLPGFENLSVPFWPILPIGFVWPYPYNLRNAIDFDAYCGRWESLLPK